MANCTIDKGTDHQTFLAWDASAQTGLGDNLTSGQNYSDGVLDAFVELGGNSVRCHLQSGLGENDTDYWGNCLTDGRDETSNAEWSAYLTNRKIPVSGTYQYSVLQWQWDSYVEPLKAKLAANGESLFWYLCFVQFSSTNQLHKDGAKYGDLMVAQFDYALSNFGEVPQAIEIWLEPTNGGSNGAQLDGADLASIINGLETKFAASAHELPLIFAPSTSTIAVCEPTYDDIATASANAASLISDMSFHRYGTQSSMAGIAAQAAADGIRTAMLEHGADTVTGNIHTLYDDLTIANVSRWQQFTIGYPFSDNGNQLFLVGSSPGYAITPGERTKYLRHYWKYIRSGAVRKDTTDSDGNFESVAFENANSAYTVVVKAATSGTINVKDLPAGTYEVRYTTGDGITTPSAYDVDDGDQTIGTGEDVVIDMPGAGVVSVYDTNYMAQNITVNYYFDSP